MQKRPTGFTILSILLGWLTIAGALNGVVALTQAESIRSVGMTPELLLFMAVLYAVTGGATAVGLWRTAPWVFRAFVIWGVTVVAGGVVFALDMRPPNMSPWIALSSLIFFPVILVPLGIYIRRRVAAQP